MRCLRILIDYLESSVNNMLESLRAVFCLQPLDYRMRKGMTALLTHWLGILAVRGLEGSLFVVSTSES